MASVSLLTVLLKVACKSSNQPSIDFEDYIEDSRSKHWDYAFVDQIAAKEINKSWEWKSKNNIHGIRASRRLIYRYWTHILLKEQVVKSQSSSFTTWVDTSMKDTIFTEEKIKVWDSAHLRQCHWYLENPKAMPPHEEVNRRQVQPEFSAPLPQPIAPIAKRKGKSTLETKSKSVASNLKAATTAKSGKRRGQPNVRQSSKRKKTLDNESDPIAPPADQVVESDAKSFKSQGRIPKEFTIGHSAAQRSQLIHRGFTNSSDAFFLNRSISEILAGSDRNLFHAAVN